MTTYAAVALAALWSVTFGYEPSADADVGYDYIVQVEPELLEAMERGEVPAIEANLPPEVTPVRRVRIVVGKEELPKKLRPPVRRATMRPKMDATSAGTLLAQTGPAGVYGRTPTGFQNAPAGSSSASATTSPAKPPTTVPPPEPRYQSFSYANPAAGNTANAASPPNTNTWSNVPGAGAAAPGVGTTQPGIVDHLGQARDNLRGVTNNLGQAGQQVIDTTREVLGNTITPPERTGYDPQGRPLSNLAERLQSEVRNTAEALRDPWERPATTPTANHVTHQGAGGPPSGQQQSQEAWTSTSSHVPPGAGGVQPGTQQPTYPAGNYGNDRYAQEQSVLNQGQGGGPNVNIQPPLLEAPNVNPNPGQYAPLQNRNPVDLNNWAVTRETSAPAQPAPQVNNSGGFESGYPNVDRQQPVVSLPAGDAWQRNAGNVSNSQSNPNPTTSVSTVPNPPGTALPEVNSGNRDNPAGPTPQSNDLAEFGGGGNTSGQHPQLHEAEKPSDPYTSGGTVLNVLAWMIAAGSVAGNLFQWGSIVDLRNKYRVALRRNSPGFGRSMAA